MSGGGKDTDLPAAHSLAGIDGQPEQQRRQRAETVGFACALARRSRAHAGLPLGAFIQMVEDAFDQGQIKCYFNDFGLCMGYLCWAYLTPQVERQLIAGADHPLHLCEWNEGASLWIIDFLVPRGALPRVLADMRDTLFAGRETITYVRVKRGKRICKRLSRTGFSHFLRNAAR